MAGSYNKVILMGNLTRDVELRHTPNNQAVAQVGLAVNRKYRTADGEMREETTFVDCEAWGRTAETLSKYLKKGRPVFLEGRLKFDQWQDKDSGQNRSKLKVVIDSFQFIDSRANEGGGGGGGGGGGYSSSSGGGGGGGGGGYAAEAPQTAPAGASGGIADDDIPF